MVCFLQIGTESKAILGRLF